MGRPHISAQCGIQPFNHNLHLNATVGLGYNKSGVDVPLFHVYKLQKLFSCDQV